MPRNKGRLAIFCAGVLLMASLIADSAIGKGGAGKKPTVKKSQSAAARTPGARRTASVRRGAQASGRGTVSRRYPLRRTFNASSGAYKNVHRNSKSYRGPSHVYVIRHPNGSIHKVGMSSRGVRKRDGQSMRAEYQARRLTRAHRSQGGKGQFTTKIIRRFPGADYARAYERRFRDTYRQLHGKGKYDTRVLPGNREHLRGRKKKE